jgi:hypothetical protein
VQGCISNALLLNCFRWVLWIVCIELWFTGSQKDSPAWFCDARVYWLTLIWSCLNPSKRYRFLCPEELICFKKASRASVLKGSWAVGVGWDNGMIMMIEDAVVVVDWER